MYGLRCTLCAVLCLSTVVFTDWGSSRSRAYFEPLENEDPPSPKVPSEPKPIPQSRQEMKQLLHDLKGRKSRLPLPILDPSSPDVSSDGRPLVHNALARRAYLPATWYAADFGNDPAMSLSYVFKTQCFWVVSRGNNCHYCLGHQEHKLHDAGLSDKQIAWLDYDWSRLDPMVRKGAALARKMTLMPHQMTDRDIEQLRPDLNDSQIIELVYTIAMFNGVNRWTDALGLPQDTNMRGKSIDFLTPVDSEIQGQRAGIAAPDPHAPARSLPSFQQQLQMLVESESRVPRVELPSAEAVRQMLGITDATKRVMHWERALATFPQVGKKQWDALESMKRDGHVPERMKAIIAWTSARRNMALSSLRSAYRRLQNLQKSEVDIERLDRGEGLTDQEVLVTKFTIKLTESPQKITDEDIEQLRKMFTDQQVAEIVYLIGAANMLDRFTETLAL